MTRGAYKQKRSDRSPERARLGRLEFHPLTPARWRDLETLFGDRGACGGCWCMWWRLGRSEFEKGKGQGNKRALKQIVDSGQVPGLVAYVNGRPLAWCAMAPRESYSVLGRSRVLGRIDDEPTWSVTCFFVARTFRRKGLTVRLLHAAVAYAGNHGARVIEGYPVEPRTGSLPDAFAYTGLPSAFRKAGFVEVLRRSETRPIMRFFVGRRYGLRS